MCIIYACTTEIPDRDFRAAAADRNDDGIGVAWIEGKAIRWEKGMDLDSLEKFLKGKEKSLLPLLLHFRSASVGGAVPELTHPFPLVEGIPTTLSGTAPAVFAHNGTISSWKEDLKLALYSNGWKMPPGHWSDSRAAAFFVQKFGEEVLRFYYDTNRLAVMRPDRKDPFSLWGDWRTEKEGGKEFGYSQSTFLSKRSKIVDSRRPSWEGPSTPYHGRESGGSTLSSPSSMTRREEVRMLGKPGEPWTMWELARVLVSLKQGTEAGCPAF